MRKTIRDVNGQVMRRNVRRDPDNRNRWMADVWFGGGYGCATTVRTYRYSSRDAARRADIGDEVGRNGCVG